MPDIDKRKAIIDMPLKKNVWDVVSYVWNIFKQAIDFGASDIHIEPMEHFLLIRFRQDKVLSKIKIDENKKPQDWKVVYHYEKEDNTKEKIDIRLSTLPTAYGEKVVMRILKQDENLTNIEALWLIDVNLEKVREALKSKYGIMLVAGPTGSGKSTTLFGILKNFNPLEYNISTLEDPIEYSCVRILISLWLGKSVIRKQQPLQ